MLLIIINWLLISIIAVPTGALLLAKFFKQENPELSTSFFTGLFGLCFISSFSSIFFPINSLFFFVLLALVILAFLFTKNISIKPIKIHLLHFIVIIPIAMVALFFSAGDILIVDEGSYFSQAVKWIESYPSIKGIANLEERIGYNSNVFVLDALFRMRFLYHPGFNDLNGLILIYFCLFIFRNQSTKIISWKYENILGLLSLVYIFKKSLSSFEPDLLNIVLGCIILMLFIHKSEKKTLSVWDNEASIIALFSFFIITIKFSSVFYLFLVLYLLIKSKWNRISIIPLITGSLLIVFWLYRNLIISGYLIFPIYHIDLFDLEWKVALVEAEKYYAHISEYAKRGIDISDNLKKNSILDISWLATWLNAELFSKVLFAGLFASLLLWIKGLVSDHRNYGFFAFLLLTILWWFFQYPSPRIAWPLIIAFFAGGIYNFFNSLSYDKFTYRVMSGIWVILICSSFHHLTKAFPQNYDNVIYPSQSLALKEKYKKYCWDQDVPCESEGGPIYRIGEEIQEGFKAVEN